MSILKKTIPIISIVIVLAVSLVTLLAWRAIVPLSEGAKFARHFASVKLKETSTLTIEGIIGLAGTTSNHLFFQMKDPSAILVTDHNLENLDTINLRIPTFPRMTSGVTTYIDSPYVTILAGRISLSIETNLNGSSYSTHKFPTTLFTRAIKVSQKSFVVRGVDTTVKKSDQIFVRIDLQAGRPLRENNISETNKDAGISTDGMLNYDNKTASMIYTHFYDNKFVCLDTNLTLVYRGQTIDHTKPFPIKSEVNKNVLTSNTPKRLVNNYSSCSNGYLFNCSVIKAENESIGNFNNNSAIDIYEVRSGIYKGSFYIPHYKSERIKRFWLTEHQIVALYKSAIIMYRYSIDSF